MISLDISGLRKSWTKVHILSPAVTRFHDAEITVPACENRFHDLAHGVVESRDEWCVDCLGKRISVASVLMIVAV